MLLMQAIPKSRAKKRKKALRAGRVRVINGKPVGTEGSFIFDSHFIYLEISWSMDNGMQNNGRRVFGVVWLQLWSRLDDHDIYFWKTITQEARNTRAFCYC